MLLKQEYFQVFIYIMLCIVIALILFFLSKVVSIQFRNVEKITSYECGFDAFDGTRKGFTVQFYLLSLCFLIFDLELIFFISLGNKFRYDMS